LNNWGSIWENSFLCGYFSPIFIVLFRFYNIFSTKNTGNDDLVNFTFSTSLLNSGCYGNLSQNFKRSYLKTVFSEKLIYFPHHLVNFLDIWIIFFFQNDRRRILYQKMHSTHFLTKRVLSLILQGYNTYHNFITCLIL